MNIEHEPTVTICQHDNIAVDLSHAQKGAGVQSTIRFKCRECGEVAWVHTSKGPMQAGTILWSWTAPAPSTPSTDAKKEPTKSDSLKGLAGTEMLLLTDELGVKSPPGCGCKSTAAMMDRLGLEECRARVADLRLIIASNWEAWGWRDKLKAVSASAWKAAGLGISPTDPVRDLLELSFERAEQKMLAAQQATKGKP